MSAAATRRSRDQADGFGTFDVRLNARRPRPEVRRPDHHRFTFDPLLPAYDIGNLRFGVRGDDWEAALFVNNVADENALLGLDQERGRVARVGYLVNQPRTYGISFSKDFGHEPSRRPHRRRRRRRRRRLRRRPPRLRHRATRTRTASRTTRIAARTRRWVCGRRRSAALRKSRCVARCSSSIRPH